jgi:hypothetical protein
MLSFPQMTAVFWGVWVAEAASQLATFIGIFTSVSLPVEHDGWGKYSDWENYAFRINTIYRLS